MADQVQRERQNTSSETTSKTNEKSSPELWKAISNLKPPDRIEESMLASTWNLLFPRICVAKSLNLKRLEDCSLYREKDQSLQYLIGYDARRLIYVWLKVGATMEDELQAYVHALLLQKVLSDSVRIQASRKEAYHSGLLQSTRKQVLQFFAAQGPSEKSTMPLMERLGQLGWDLRGRLHLGFSSRRLETFTKED